MNILTRITRSLNKQTSSPSFLYSAQSKQPYRRQYLFRENNLTSIDKQCYRYFSNSNNRNSDTASLNQLIINSLNTDGEDESLKLLNNVIENSSGGNGSSLAYRARGNLYAKIGDIYNSMINYQKAVECDPKSTKALLATAKIFISINDWDSAKSVYQHILSIDPNYLAAYSWLGFYELERSNVEKAKELFNKVLEKQANDSEALMGLGTIAIHNENIDQSIDYFNRAVQDYGNDIKQEEDDIDTIIDKHGLPNNSPYQFCFSKLGSLYRYKGDLESSIRNYEKALEIEANLDELLIITDIYLEQNQPLQALKYIDQSIMMDPSNVKAIVNKAVALLALQRYQESLQEFMNFKSLVDQDDPTSLIKRLVIYPKMITCCILILNQTTPISFDTTDSTTTSTPLSAIINSPPKDIDQLLEKSVRLHDYLVEKRKNTQPPQPFIDSLIDLTVSLRDACQDTIKVSQSNVNSEFKTQFQDHTLFFNSYYLITNKMTKFDQ
ncbi:hypothetical protein CYY_007697 [Polysphondylium violaceum]|uniref:Tetratricopeptide-like helical domain-containing protein n=1 Tax=Polysphondylium violaceum TaxID=133409 RepID=A0A8J4UQP9_9MYCE|nr:hypothetical protein CYY_007697 [Polysphondylium violaceum]